MAISLLPKQTVAVTFDCTIFFDRQKLSSSRVTDVVFIIKKKQIDTDRNAVLTKSLLNGSISIISQTMVSVLFEPNDFKVLECGESYVYGLGFKVPEFDHYVEPMILDREGKNANFIHVGYNFINN